MLNTLTSANDNGLAFLRRGNRCIRELHGLSHSPPDGDLTALSLSLSLRCTAKRRHTLQNGRRTSRSSGSSRSSISRLLWSPASTSMPPRPRIRMRRLQVKHSVHRQPCIRPAILATRTRGHSDHRRALRVVHPPPLAGVGTSPTIIAQRARLRAASYACPRCPRSKIAASSTRGIHHKTARTRSRRWTPRTLPGYPARSLQSRLPAIQESSEGATRLSLH